jgi:hypothetical protein
MDSYGRPQTVLKTAGLASASVRGEPPKMRTWIQESANVHAGALKSVGLAVILAVVAVPQRPGYPRHAHCELRFRAGRNARALRLLPWLSADRADDQVIEARLTRQTKPACVHLSALPSYSSPKRLSMDSSSRNRASRSAAAPLASSDRRRCTNRSTRGLGITTSPSQFVSPPALIHEFGEGLCLQDGLAPVG